MEEEEEELQQQKRPRSFFWKDAGQVECTFQLITYFQEIPLRGLEG